MAKKKGSSKNEENAPKQTKVAESLCAESSISSCMEAAITPLANIGDVVENAEVTDMCADLATAPCSDEDDAYNELANAPCTDAELAAVSSSTEIVATSPSLELTTESSAEIQTDGGVTDLVAQQLRQMIEEGGGTATCASAGSFTGTHTMNLNVKAGAVDMNLSTVTEANQELIELKTQIELQKKLLADAQDRLDVANQRIGFLESEIARRDVQLEHKRSQGNWLRSLLGLKT